MRKIEKSTNLYPHPFSRAYWHDAAQELKDTKMLVIAALMIALRVSMKWTAIPLAPNLNINVGAPLINAMGAMIFGPVVAALAACVSDFAGYLLFPQGGVYFLPYMFVEVAGSVLFALFFYRAKVTVTRVILARFSMDLFVNIILNSFVSMWYYAAVLGKSYTFMILPAVIKNLGLFPIESFLLSLFLSVVIPVTRRMKLTYTPVSDGAEAEKRPTGSELKFDKKHLVLLLVLFAIGVSCVVGYLAYYYDLPFRQLFPAGALRHQHPDDGYCPGADWPVSGRGAGDHGGKRVQEIPGGDHHLPGGGVPGGRREAWGL